MTEPHDWTIVLRGGPLAPADPVTISVRLPELPERLPDLGDGHYHRDPEHGLAYDWRPDVVDLPFSLSFVYGLFALGILIQFPIIYLQADTGNWGLIPGNVAAILLMVFALWVFRRRQQGRLSW